MNDSVMGSIGQDSHHVDIEYRRLKGTEKNGGGIEKLSNNVNSRMILLTWRIGQLCQI